MTDVTCPESRGEDHPSGGDGVSPTSPTWLLMQRGLALVMLVLLSPVFLVMFVAVKATSPGPFLFTQRRPGLRGTTFTIYKVRTMRSGAESATALGATEAHSAITRVGRILRDLNVDELPQLWNVVRGDMELAGPRPVPQALHDELCRRIPGFDARNAVRPGLTNISRVSTLDNEVNERLLDDWRARLVNELHDIKKKSVTYDVALTVLTGVFVLRKFVRRLLGRGPEARDGAHLITTDGQIPVTRVLGVPVANLDDHQTLNIIAQWIRERSHRYVNVCRVDSIVEAAGHRGHQALLEEASLNAAGGMRLVWAQMLFGHRRATRVDGTTLMMTALERAQREGWRVALYGGHPDRLPTLLENLDKKLPSLNVVEAIARPLRPVTVSDDEIDIARLHGAAPDLILVGLGGPAEVGMDCPSQEEWMAERSPRIPGVMVGVGTAFDFHAGSTRRTPLRRRGMTNALYAALIVGQAIGTALRRRSNQEHRVPPAGVPDQTTPVLRDTSLEERTAA